MIDFEMIDIGALAVATFLGAVLSGLYFGALWMTLRRLTHHRHPAVLLMLSLLLRLTLLLIGFYLILDRGHWDRLLAALIGFILVRILLTRMLGPVSASRVARSRTEIPS